MSKLNMTMEIQISANQRAELSTYWDGSVNVRLLAKPSVDGKYVFTGGLMLDPVAARAMAIWLLHYSGQADILIKKHRPEL